MSYASGVNYNPQVRYSLSQVKDILLKLDEIDGLTDNDYIIRITEQIRNILDKQV